MTFNSVVIDPSTTPSKQQRQEAGIQLVDYDDLILGASLGRGCFANVREVLHWKARTGAAGQAPPHIDMCCQDMSYGNLSLSRYAIKCLRTDFEKPETFRRAARDLETEVALLTNIAHPNIIKVYAKSASDTDPSDCTQDNVQDFFIVMDRLSENLTKRITRWNQEQIQVKAACTPFLFGCRSPQTTHKGSKPFDPFLERLQVGQSVALALAYLHMNCIVYRDLKADNVGFDMNGKVKLFDFGLARRLPDASKAQQVKGETCYAMTKLVGSLPHMAPEVYKGEAYNEKADVYSFAILLWVIMSLDMPYIDLAYDLNVLKKQVMINGRRPTVPSRWPKNLQSLLGEAWHPEMEKRPSMQEVCDSLKGLIAAQALPTKSHSKHARIKRSLF